ncbi:MAG: hypothetical protein JHC95_08055 [Solirubrobacteraceae bacterium]|nr:hypothetical protein [Solirubrobacteraceae bacterium]
MIRRAASGTAVLAALAAAAAPAASASSSTAINACLYDLNDTWGDVLVTVDSTPALRGDRVALTGTRIDAMFPQWVSDYLKVLGAGRQTLQVKAWIALAAAGSTEGVQVRTVQGTATTVVGEDGGTPLVFTAPPLADTTWTPNGAPVLTFLQAGPSALPATVPAGRAGAAVRTRGSLFISASKRLGAGLGELRFNMDCQPGTTPNGPVRNSETFSPLVAEPFAAFQMPTPEAPGGTVLDPATVPRPDAVPTAPVPGAGAPDAGSPQGATTGVTIRSTRLIYRRTSLPLRIACPAGGSACEGSLAIRTWGTVRIGSKRRVVTLARTGYEVPAGRSRSRTLTLTREGRSLWRTTRRVFVEVSLYPSDGTPVHKKLALRRVLR